MALLVVSASAVAGDLRQAVDTCAAIGEDKKRLACFDKLSSAPETDNDPAIAEPADAPAGTAAAATASSAASKEAASKEEESPPILPRHYAGDGEEGKAVFNVRLTRCAQTSATGRQIYYFDNGEVWRQSNDSRKKIRNCDTAVTVEQDVFGYKMRVPSEGRSIRIRPVR